MAESSLPDRTHPLLLGTTFETETYGPLLFELQDATDSSCHE